MLNPSATLHVTSKNLGEFIRDDFVPRRLPITYRYKTQMPALATRMISLACRFLALVLLAARTAAKSLSEDASRLRLVDLVDDDTRRAAHELLLIRQATAAAERLSASPSSEGQIRIGSCTRAGCSSRGKLHISASSMIILLDCQKIIIIKIIDLLKYSVKT